MMRLILGILLAILILQPSYAGELINRHMPPNLNVDLQLRYRLEAKDNFDFNDSREDNDTYHLLRTRLGLSYTPLKQVELYAQMQDSRAMDVQDYAESALVHYADFRQLYASLKDIIEPQGAIPHTKLTFGRQSLHFGSGRLIGDPDWSNLGQTFDAGRLGFAWDDARLKVDVFGGNFTANKSPREANDFFDRATRDTSAGYYASWESSSKLTIEQYLITRKTNKNVSFGPSGSHELNEYTSGARIIGKELNGFDYEVDMAGQWGRFDDQDISAFMGVALAGYTFNIPWKPRLGFEFDYASGDSDPADGTRHTFDNLYPANHNFYGYMDLVGLQNLNAYRYTLSANPTSKLKVSADYHRFYLDTPKDSFYSANRAVTRTAVGAVDTHIGDEVDLWASYKLCKFSSIVVGYSRFLAGKFIRQTGANDDADFIYSAYTLNF